jgi:integrase
MSLNDTAIKALRPKSSRYKVFDGGGLYIEVIPTGLKIWRVKVRHEGKDKRVTLGRYPAVTLKNAREKLAALKERLATGQGIEPPPPESDSAFSAVALEWIDRKSPIWGEDHKKTVLYRLDRFVFPHIGNRAIEKVPPMDILKLIRAIENDGKNHTAHRVLGICSQVFRYGVASGKCPSDPCRDLAGALTCYAEKPRAAIINPKEAGELMVRIGAYKARDMRYMLLWSAYTFCRPGEVRQAEWSEIDWENKEWRIPAEKMKMRFEHRVPLATQCVDILERLKKHRISERWIFPSKKDKTKSVSEAGALSALRRMGYEKDEMTPHGFRAMASTLLNELGFKPDIIERQLAHGDVDKVRAVYNRAAYMDERRVMMQRWADYLDGLAFDSEISALKEGLVPRQRAKGKFSRRP